MQKVYMNWSNVEWMKIPEESTQIMPTKDSAISYIISQNNTKQPVWIYLI